MVYFYQFLLNTEDVILKLYTSLCQKAKCTLFGALYYGMHWDPWCRSKKYCQSEKQIWLPMAFNKKTPHTPH